MTPLDRSRAALPANIRRTLEESNLPIEVATAIADHCEAAFEAGYKASEEEFHAPLGTEPLPAVMLEALDITREAVAAQVEELEAVTHFIIKNVHSLPVTLEVNGERKVLDADGVLEFNLSRSQGEKP